MPCCGDTARRPSAPAPVSERTSISAYLAALYSLESTVPSHPQKKPNGMDTSPGLSSGNQEKSTPVSVIIDSDVLSFIHRTPAEASADERAYGESSKTINQLDEFPEASGATLSAGADPGQLGAVAHRRQYENFLSALDGEAELRVSLETNRQAIAIITGVYESARTGRPVALT